MQRKVHRIPALCEHSSISGIKTIADVKEKESCSWTGILKTSSSTETICTKMKMKYRFGKWIHYLYKNGHPLLTDSLACSNTDRNHKYWHILDCMDCCHIHWHLYKGEYKEKNNSVSTVQSACMPPAKTSKKLLKDGKRRKKVNSYWSIWLFKLSICLQRHNIPCVHTETHLINSPILSNFSLPMHLYQGRMCCILQ